MRFLSIVMVLWCMCSLMQARPSAKFPQVECANPNRFSKAQKDHIIYAYNFGAPKGMGYIMAAIAWQESCAGAYMVNFSDPSAGLYHAHIPMVLKYYSSYNDTSFARNVMGQLLIDDRRFASQVALDSLMYWWRHHKGNYKNIIKSYNKGFKWQKGRESNKLAESYYLNISKKVRALESFIPRFSGIKNKNVFIENHDKNKSATMNQRTQDAKSLHKATRNHPKQTSKPTKPSPVQKNQAKKSLPNNPMQNSKKNKQDDFIDIPLEGDSSAQDSTLNYDANFEDFTLIFEGH